MITFNSLNLNKDTRLIQLKECLNKFFNSNDYTVIKVSHDASFRRYFRVIINNNSYIMMDAPPKLENINQFTTIADFFHKYNINTPKIYLKNSVVGLLLMSDFGDITLLKQQQNKFDIDLYKLAIDELIKIQNLPINKLKIKNYSSVILQQEMQLCTSWYNKNNNYTELFAFLTNSIARHNKVIVHRDYHSRNIMYYNNIFGILDFQDAIIGSYVYDLASLLKDAYIKLKNSDVEQLLQYFFIQTKLKNYTQFMRDFDLAATQRHIKILGIFTRLNIRDNKPQYLQDIPLVINYLLKMSEKYNELNILKKLCKQ